MVNIKNWADASILYVSFYEFVKQNNTASCKDFLEFYLEEVRKVLNEQSGTQRVAYAELLFRGYQLLEECEKASACGQSDISVHVRQI